ncbi:hypothetical protein D3C75_1358550 [compost metagenome]
MVFGDKRLMAGVFGVLGIQEVVVTTRTDKHAIRQSVPEALKRSLTEGEEKLG